MESIENGRKKSMKHNRYMPFSLAFDRRLLTACMLCLAALTSCSRQDKIAAREVLFQESPPGLVKIVTFNIHYAAADSNEAQWGLRRELVIDSLADHAADVMGLQDVLDFQLKDIKRALPEYEAVAAGRDDGEQAGPACPVLYRVDRFRLADSGTFWFSNSPWKAGSKHWGNTYPRICTWARLTEIGTNKSFYVYNLHLDDDSENSRQYSMELLDKQISKRERYDPVIVMGDFNMGTEAPAMAAWKSKGYRKRFVDVWQHLHPEQPEIKTYNAAGSQPDGPCLDHILADSTIMVTGVEIDARRFRGQYPSDHFPVIARLQID